MNNATSGEARAEYPTAVVGDWRKIVDDRRVEKIG
jgi:hypothetical protein